MGAIDRQWIEAALQDYESPLTRYAASLVGDLDRARDLVQETFLRLCEQDPSKVRDHLAQWLFTVCRNLAFDLARKERHMTSMDAGISVATQPDPADQLERHERRGRLERLLDGLKPDQREVLRLKFQDDLSYREISRITGLSVSNVGFLIHTAIRTIRERRIAEEAASGMRRVK